MTSHQRWALARARGKLRRLGVAVRYNRRSGTYQLVDEFNGSPVRTCRFSFADGVTWCDELYRMTAGDVARFATT